MRVAAVIVAALLCASPAEAKSVCLIGDSIMWGVAGSGSGRSPAEPGTVLQGGVNALPNTNAWYQATVYNLAVQATHPADWVGPVTSGLCSLVNAAPSAFPHPNLVAACRNGDGIADHMPACNACIVLADASEAQNGTLTVTQAVDELQSLLTKLNGPGNCTDGVILASPPLQKTLAGSTNSQFDAVLTEIQARSITVNITWSPRLLVGKDTVHLTDSAYIRMGDAFLRALP